MKAGIYARGASSVTIGAFVCALWTGVALAQGVQIRNVGCDQGIHLVARAAPASEVLWALSRSVDFRLTVDEPIDAVVTIDATRPTHRLLTDLLGPRSAIITERKDPRCPGRYRVERVWVLRAGAAVQPTAAAPKAPSWVVTPEARAQDELYQRAHGMLPP